MYVQVCNELKKHFINKSSAQTPTYSPAIFQLFKVSDKETLENGVKYVQS